MLLEREDPISPMFTPLNASSPPPANPPSSVNPRNPASRKGYRSCQKLRFLAGAEEDCAGGSTRTPDPELSKRPPHRPQKLKLLSQVARQLRHCKIPTSTFVALRSLCQ